MISWGAFVVGAVETVSGFLPRFLRIAQARMRFGPGISWVSRPRMNSATTIGPNISRVS